METEIKVVDGIELEVITAEIGGDKFTGIHDHTEKPSQFFGLVVKSTSVIIRERADGTKESWKFLYHHNAETGELVRTTEVPV